MGLGPAVLGHVEVSSDKVGLLFLLLSGQDVRGLFRRGRRDLGLLFIEDPVGGGQFVPSVLLPILFFFAASRHGGVERAVGVVLKIPDDVRLRRLKGQRGRLGSAVPASGGGIRLVVFVNGPGFLPLHQGGEFVFHLIEQGVREKSKFGHFRLFQPLEGVSDEVGRRQGQGQEENENEPLETFHARGL